MRIAVPSASALLTDSTGHGEGLIAWSLLCGLAARGHELVVWTRRAELASPPPFELVELGPASRWESIEPLAYARATGAAVERMGGASRFDVAWWLYPGEPDNLFLPQRGLPFVLGPVSCRWPGGRGRPLAAGDVIRFLAAPVFAIARRRMLSSTSVVLLATPDAGPRIRARTRVVPLGVDEQRFPPTRPSAGERVAFVGRLEPEKGVRDLVEAFELLLSERPGATLILAGTGSERAWVESRARDLNGSLELLGPVPHGAVADVFRDSSLVCVPSHGEPYGMVVLEAMASGRAVVATDSGGPRFLVDRERGGRLVPPNDAAALARALADLLGDPERLEEMGRFNRRRVETEFGFERTLDAVESALTEAAAR